jgi:hypothetical protein
MYSIYFFNNLLNSSTVIPASRMDTPQCANGKFVVIGNDNLGVGIIAAQVDMTARLP